MSAEPRTGDCHHDAVLGSVTVQDVRDGHVYLTALREGQDPHAVLCAGLQRAPDTGTAAVPDLGALFNNFALWAATDGAL